MSEVRWAFFLPNRRAPETVRDIAKISLGCLCELLGQKHALQGCHVVRKQEMGEATEIRGDDAEAISMGNTGRSSGVNENKCFFIYLCTIRSSVCSDLGTLYRPQTVQ